jgi:RNA polymerase sigma-70 factor, ECF subfamily
MAIASEPKVSGGPLDQEYEAIFRQHSHLVYRTAYSILGSPSDADDVLQSIFLKLIEREIPLDLRRNPQGYLYRAAVNVSLNIVRARKNQVLTGDFASLDVPAPDPPPAEENPRRRHLIQAIAQLRPKLAEILILRYAYNYSDAEIARVLGKSRGTIAVTLYRARARLGRLVRLAEKMEKP